MRSFAFIVENWYDTPSRLSKYFKLASFKKYAVKNHNTSSYPISCNNDMYRAMPGNSWAGPRGPIQYKDDILPV